MSSIRQRLLSTEDDFLSAVDIGGHALEAFSERWHALQEDVDAAVASLALDDDTLSLANLVASRLDSMASTFEHIFGVVASVEASMKGELEDMFSRLTVDDVDEPRVSWNIAEALSTASPENITRILSDWTLDISHPESPAPSSRSTRVPSLVSDSFSDDGESEDDDDEEIIPYISRLGKRCYKSYAADSDETTRRHKRHRSSTHFPIESPAPWFWDEGDDVPRETDNDQLHTHRKIRAVSSCKAVTVTPPPTTVPISAVQSRKRRLSDAAVDRPRKRPRDLHVEPKRQAVSNPLPVSNHNLEEPLDNLGHWATQFTVVEPATFSMPTTSAPLEIDWRGLGGSAKFLGKSVAPDFVGTSAATEPSFDEVLRKMTVSSADVVVPTTVDAVATATEGEVTSDADVTADDHPLSDPEDSAAASVEDILQPPSLPTTQAPEVTSSAPTESTLHPASPFPPESDSVTQSDNTSLATTPSLLAPPDLSVPADANKIRSRSSSPSRTPLPSFESATADLSSNWNPPTYSAFDLFPEMNSDTPPPPYCHSPQESGPTHDKAFDASALFAELLPLAFSGKKRGFSEAFNQHVQVPLAGFAISAV